MVMFVRLPTNEDGSRKSYAQRRAERRQQDAERRAQQKNEPPTHDAIYELPFDERRRLRRAEQQGRREGEQRAAMEAEAKRQAEFDALPVHEQRPVNSWRLLIEQWKSQEHRPEVRRKLEKYRIEAEREDARIDAMLAERKRQYEIDNDPEVQKARTHLESVQAGIETEEERNEFARLSGLLAAGQSGQYWTDVAPICQLRLRKMQERWDEQIAAQAVTVAETKAMAEQLATMEELQVKQEETTNQQVTQ